MSTEWALQDLNLSPPACRASAHRPPEESSDEPQHLRLGLRKYKKLPPEEVANLYQQGWSSNEIAERFGAKPTSVLRCLKELGVETRSVSATVALGRSRGRLEAVTRRRLRFNDFEIRGRVCAIFSQDRQGKSFEILIDAADLPKVQEHGRRWYVVQRSYTHYARASCSGRTTYLHHFLVGLSDRRIPVDHRNHNGLDNRRQNLRVTTTTVNGLNRSGPRKGSRSGLRGVVWSSQKKRWQAKITPKRKAIHLGFFSDKEEAARVVHAKLIEMEVIGYAS